MLILLRPDLNLPISERLSELRIRVDFVKELGGTCRGLFYSYGLVYEFPDHLFDEWQEILDLDYFC